MLLKRRRRLLCCRFGHVRWSNCTPKIQPTVVEPEAWDRHTGRRLQWRITPPPFLKSWETRHPLPTGRIAASSGLLRAVGARGVQCKELMSCMRFIADRKFSSLGFPVVISKMDSYKRRSMQPPAPVCMQPLSLPVAFIIAVSCQLIRTMDATEKKPRRRWVHSVDVKFINRKMNVVCM